MSYRLPALLAVNCREVLLIASIVRMLLSQGQPLRIAQAVPLLLVIISGDPHCLFSAALVNILVKQCTVSLLKVCLDFVGAARTRECADSSLEDAWKEALSFVSRLECVLGRHFWVLVALRIDPFCLRGWKKIVVCRFRSFLARSVADDEKTAECSEGSLALRVLLVDRLNGHGSAGVASIWIGGVKVRYWRKEGMSGLKDSATMSPKKIFEWFSRGVDWKRDSKVRELVYTTYIVRDYIMMM